MTSLMAGASKFAHFAGLTRASKRAADGDDDQKQGRGAEDGEDDKTASEDGDDEPKGKRSRKAEENADDTSASDGDGDGDDDKPAGKRSKKAEEDEDDKSAEDDDEDEMKGKSAAASARRREQARITHIVTHKAAANNPVLALSLACDTRMTRQEAVALLKAQPAQEAREDGGNRHARRDRQDRNASLGGDAPAQTGKQAVAASWDATLKKVGIKTR